MNVMLEKCYLHVVEGIDNGFYTFCNAFGTLHNSQNMVVSIFTYVTWFIYLISLVKNTCLARVISIYYILTNINMLMKVVIEIIK